MSATYLAYIVFWESFVWCGAAYCVVWKRYTPWLWLLGFILSQAAYSPAEWAALR